MKRILLSIMTIALVATVAVGATRAYFTDTEQSLGNTFSTGTIDIAVDGENPWSSENQFNLTDMKPSQVDYSNFTIQNVGTNPANVWKEVKNVVTEENGTNEPELAYYAGNSIDPAVGKNDIDTEIEYDLSVKLKKPTGEVVWNQMLYNKDKTINDIKDTKMFLGMIPAGWSMDVVESYHMNTETDNWAQSDKMTFNIVLTAEQLKGTAVLEDKTGDPDWMVIGDNDIKGTLTYGVKDSKFNFSFTGKVTLLSTGYSLIVYKEPWSVPSAPEVWPRPVIVLGSATSDGSGNVNIPDTSVDLGMNLINAKIWLVKTSDLVGDTLSGWDPSNYLFDTGVIDYYDTDL